ncbi:hypothetical protein CEXT_153201 [Caerostris extrusa]|uniref:Uncharacterized protein n=1 Tax=Caerostris extrusa TaxID=172846 RepID=A0AAV4RBG0_CAEEX|nr:hypothetical protein CEXT_153201 [Caerostris extrusa]
MRSLSMISRTKQTASGLNISLKGTDPKNLNWQRRRTDVNDGGMILVTRTTTMDSLRQLRSKTSIEQDKNVCLMV